MGGSIQVSTKTIINQVMDLEASEGNFEMGLALGLLLLPIAFAVNLLLRFLDNKA